jgi:iron complex outermembrane receptor protein
VDLQGGKIDGGTKNFTAEAYMNIPLIADWTALRISVFDDYHGGFINNINTTRTWANGVVSDNSAWSGKNYNVEKVTGARIALGQKFTDTWKASLTWSYQRQLTQGAWDQDPTTGGAVDADGNLVNGPQRPFGKQNVARFGPEFKQYYTKTLDLHVDGDIGIADLVFASTYWQQDSRWVNEYSEYMQYYNTSAQSAQQLQANACLTDPFNGAGFSGCQAPTQYYDYINHTQRWSNELRLQSKEGNGNKLHWVAGTYWERTKDIYSDIYHEPGLQQNGQQYQATVAYNTYYYGTAIQPAPSADDWYSYVGRSDYLQVTEFGNVQWDALSWLHLEGGLTHFHSNFNSGTYGGFWTTPQYASQNPGSSSKWNGKAGISVNITKDALVYADWSQGFRDGGSNAGLPSTCKAQGIPASFTPDTLTNYEIGWKTSWLDRHLSWNGALYYMPWKNLQSLIYNPELCPSSSFTANIGDARVYGMESEVKWQPNANLSMDFSGSYNDSRVKTNNFQFDPTTGNQVLNVVPGERLPYVPYFSWSAYARYEHPLHDALHGYAQYDIAHKGDMWNTLEDSGSNGLPRLLQPAYTVMNLRFGLNQTDEHWTTELFITNLTNKNAVIYTNEGNFDIRQTINEPRVFGVRLSYRFGKQGGNTAD